LGKSLSLPDELNSSSGQNDERASSLSQPVERGLGNKIYWGIKGVLLTALIADGIYLYKTMGKTKGDATNATNAPTSTGQTNSSGGTTSRRNERLFGRGLPVDISGEPHPKSRLEHR
jgi:hypothetical protein